MNQQFLEGVDAFLLKFDSGRVRQYFLHVYTGSCLLCGHPVDSHGNGSVMARTKMGDLVLQEIPADKGCLVAVEDGRCKCKWLLTFDAEDKSPFRVTSSSELEVTRWDFFLWLVAKGVYNEGTCGEMEMVEVDDE